MFVSTLQRSDGPAAEQVRRAVATTLRQRGIRGCAAQVAGEFGDHPETAVTRMRWAIETMFETLHAWGQERFMVRSWQAIDRLLWILAIAYALLLLVLHHPALQRFRAEAEALLRRLSVVGQRLTIGKLAEAIRLDWARHDRAWTSGWLL